jgi:cytochrome c553
MLMKLFYSAVCLLIFTANVFASGDPVAGKEKSAICAACHAADGNSTIPAWPKIAGQHEDYLYQQLLDFKSGKRENPQMLPILIPFNEEDLSNIAAFYASQTQTQGTASKTITINGEELDAKIIDAEYMYRVGNPDNGLSACMACHGPNGAGNPAAKFPAINGQHAEYTATTLKAYKSEARANDPNSIMRSIASKMTNEDIELIANYLQGLY